MTKAELIKKFLDNSCTDEEAGLVMQYLEAEPSLLDQMLAKSEWDEIDTSVPIAPRVEMEMRKHITSKTWRPILRISKSTLRAAAMLSGVAFGLIVLYNSTRTWPVEDRFATTVETAEARQKVFNHTSQNKHIILADNSTISLFPGSSVEYNTAFKTRSIKLSGKAIFNVTRHTSSEFVVYSGAISTTALGTRFLVDNSDDANKINVKLFEGRVVVQPTDTNFIIGKTFLAAGEQCFVDIARMLVKVEPLFTSNTTAHRKANPVDKNRRFIPSIQAASRLTFSKTPLHEVLENLQEVYKQTIHFNTDEISGSHFTGSFSVGDSLTTILKMISVMHDLSVKGEDGTLRIVKAMSRSDTPENHSRPDERNAPVYKLALVEKMTLAELAPNADSITISDIIRLEPELRVVEKTAIKYTRIPLPDLLNELQKQTNRRIHFQSEQLEKINFSGSIPFDEAVRTTLSTICRINGLTLTLKKGAYYISKTQQ